MNPSVDITFHAIIDPEAWAEHHGGETFVRQAVEDMARRAGEALQEPGVEVSDAHARFTSDQDNALARCGEALSLSDTDPLREDIDAVTCLTNGRVGDQILNRGDIPGIVAQELRRLAADLDPWTARRLNNRAEEVDPS